MAYAQYTDIIIACDQYNHRAVHENADILSMFWSTLNV